MLNKVGGGALAKVPTWREQGLKVVASNWRNVVGPQGMNAAQTQFWDGVFARLTQQDEWKKDIAAHHFADTYLNSAGTRKLMQAQFSELASWLRALGLVQWPHKKSIKSNTYYNSAWAWREPPQRALAQLMAIFVSLLEIARPV